MQVLAKSSTKVFEIYHLIIRINGNKYMRSCNNGKSFYLKKNEFLIFIHKEICTLYLRNSGDKKTLASENYRLKPATSIHWETFSRSYYFGKTFPYVNTYGGDWILYSLC